MKELNRGLLNRLLNELTELSDFNRVFAGVQGYGRNVYMAYEENIIKIALYVACNDGVLSEEEEEQLVKLSLIIFPSVDQKQIDFWIEEFFEEDLLLENYCEKIASLEDKLIALKIATETASADGLDLKENLALSRVINYWGIPWEEITSA